MSSFHSIPLSLFACVYEKPETWPVLRPNKPWRFGPILFGSPSFRVWHCAHRVYVLVNFVLVEESMLRKYNILWIAGHPSCRHLQTISRCAINREFKRRNVETNSDVEASIMIMMSITILPQRSQQGWFRQDTKICRYGCLKGRMPRVYSTFGWQIVSAIRKLTYRL